MGGGDLPASTAGSASLLPLVSAHDRNGAPPESVSSSREGIVMHNEQIAMMQRNDGRSRARLASHLLCLALLFLPRALHALDRSELTFYLPFEGSYAPAIGPAQTEVKLKDFVLPSLGSFMHMTEDNKRYFEPDDKSPRKLEFVPGRRGQGLKVTENPTRFKVYSYPCVQYVARECFAPKEGTIAFWMKPMGWSGDNAHRYFIAVTADNCTIRFYTFPGGTYVWLDAKDQFRILGAGAWHDWKDGEWAFLAFSYKPGQQCFYVNGQLQMKSTDGLIEPEFVNKGLIEISEGDQVVDELMVFNRPLTAAEVASLYQANGPESESKR
jgi:hypothetical protein